MPTAVFEFISHSADAGAGLKKTDQIRIRKQAMKVVALTRRQRGNYGKRNAQRLPSLVINHVEDDSSNDHNTDITGIPNDALALENPLPYMSLAFRAPGPGLMSSESLPRAPSSFGFQSVMIRYGVNVLDLSGLTAVHVGRAAAIYSSAKPSTIKSILGYRHWSYLSYVPSRYGKTSCLDDAVNCLAAKAGQILSTYGHFSDTSVMSLYGKALQNLQVALNDSRRCLEADVLCATEILALFEFLNFSHANGHTWKHHTAGASQLIQIRGPRSYTTDYEKFLLMAFVGVIFSEAIMANQSCFLEDKEWTETLEAVIIDNPQDPFADRSPIVVALWTYLIPIARLFKDVTSIICQDSQINQESVTNIILRGLRIRDNFLRWRQEFNCLLAQQFGGKQPETDFLERYEVSGLYMACHALLNRVIGSVSSLRRVKLEEESQALSSAVLQMLHNASLRSARAEFFLSQKAAITRSIVNTATIWTTSDDTAYKSTHESIIERWRFEHWCGILDRTIPRKSPDLPKTQDLISTIIASGHLF